MRKLMILVLTSLTLSFSACDDPEKPGVLNVETVGHVLNEVQKNQGNDGSMESQTSKVITCPQPILANFVPGNKSYTDWSGQVTVTVFQATALAGDPNADYAVQIPDDYVLVGGGARVSDTENVFITGSYPCNNTWAVRTKDHNSFPFHGLTVYAIGLKLSGISADELRKHVAYGFIRDINTSFNGKSISSSLSSPYKLIGGGIRVDVALHYLFQNYATTGSRTWNVWAKSHYHTSYSRSSLYTIAIKSYIPGFGYLDIGNGFQSTNTANYQPGTAHYNVPTGWVLTNAGGKVNYNGGGRLLTAIYPDGNGVTVNDRDWWYADGGTLEAHASYIRKRP